ncbi:lytic transglycosylase domain-containing protein [Methylosarcina fibrata]|uniref:lytic transglycosylase domain-containing protein n=1 Tax=Methylosarcina fibrata TaxID=105972 RepID=UPI000382EEB5|nr:lytic transglycosylase domain-containing protein [Methylosarcina fibrata]
MRTKFLLKRAYHDTVSIPLLLLISAGFTHPARVPPSSLTVDHNEFREIPPPLPDHDKPDHKMADAHVQKKKALANYIQHQFKVTENKASVIVSEAFNNGVKQGLQPELILAIIAVESKFKEKAVSPKGARGLMQVLASAHPKKIKSIGGTRALYNARKNISVGTHILAEYKDLSKGNIRRTLLRYNGSLGNNRSHYPDKVFRIYKQMKNTARLNEQLQVAQLQDDRS